MDLSERAAIEARGTSGAKHPWERARADFTVERDGSIWNLNPDLRKNYCYHAGRATSWRAYRNGEINRVTVGIEIVQHAKLALSPLYPQPQVIAVASLCAWLVAHFSLAASDIVTHRQIITDGSRSDPRKFPFDDQLGFWHHYWDAYGKAGNYLESLTFSDH